MKIPGDILRSSRPTVTWNCAEEQERQTEQSLTIMNDKCPQLRGLVCASTYLKKELYLPIVYFSRYKNLIFIIHADSKNRKVAVFNSKDVCQCFCRKGEMEQSLKQLSLAFTSCTIWTPDWSPGSGPLPQNIYSVPGNHH